MIRMGEDVNIGSSDTIQTRTNTPPPVEALTSIPTDRIRELYEGFGELQQRLDENPGSYLKQTEGETILLFFTLSSAILEKRCVLLMLQSYPSEEYPDNIGNRREYLARNVSQADRIEYLYQELEEFDDGVKGLVKDVWKARCALVHDSHKYRRPNFNIEQKGQKALDAIDQLQQI